MPSSDNDLIAEDCPYCGTTIVAGDDVNIMAAMMEHWIEEEPEEMECIRHVLEDFINDE